MTAAEVFLAADEVVQAGHPAVRAAAARLREGRTGDDAGFARAAYEFVRDQVRHSFDADDPRVTVAAAEVLEQRVGLCYRNAGQCSGFRSGVKARAGRAVKARAVP